MSVRLFIIIFLVSFSLKASGQSQYSFDRKKYLGRNCVSVIKEGYWGVLDTKGDTLLVPIEYDSLAVHMIGIRALKNSKWVLLDIDKGVKDKVKSSEYDEIASSFPRVGTTRLLAVRRAGKIGFLDRQYNEIVPLIYDNVNILAYDYAIGVRQGKTVLIDQYTGKELTPLKYDFIRYKGRDFLHVGDRRTRKIGVIDSKGKEIIPMIYEDFDFHISQKVFSAKKDGKYALHEPISFKPMTEFVYDKLYDIKIDGFIKARKNNLYGLIDVKGTIIIDFVYDSLALEGDEIVAIKGGVKYKYDLKGKMIK